MPKPYYKPLQTETAQKLNSHKGMFSFAVLADSHLDNSIDDTCANIKAVNAVAPFDCVMHLGDIMCGGFSRKTIKPLMKKEIDKFRAISKNGCFYPTRGNHDGFHDFVNSRSDVRLDCDWCEAISYIDSIPGVSHPDGKPYFYVDYPQYGIRIISLNSFFYKEVDGEFVKGGVNGYDDEQYFWFKNDALCVTKDTTVIVISHDAPFKDFEGDFREDNPIYNGNKMIDAIHDGVKSKGFKFAAWLIGHYHGDMVCTKEGINYVLIASETAYVPALWDMPKGGYYLQRALGTATEDLWDAVSVDTDEQKMYFFRFGAGEDRVVSY